MTRALISKELREHFWLFFALMGLHALTVLALLYRARDEGSVFTAVRQFSITLGVVGVLVANNRLIVREYSGRTQLFLETLPVTRLRILTVKLLLGLATVLFPLALVLACCALMAKDSEPVTGRYLAILALRSGTFLFGVHGLGFLAAMLGRYRYVLWGALFFAITFITKNQDSDIIPLFMLVNEKLPFERNVLPAFELWTTAAASAACIAIAFVLGLTQEGGLASNLARKMSHREKVFFGGLALVIIVIDTTIAERRARPLFELAKAARASSGSTFVGIATVNDDAATLAPARATGTEVAEDLESLRVWLGLREMPPVFVVPDSSLDPDDFVRAKLDDTDGVVLKAPLADPAIDPRAFRAYAIDQVFAWYSRNRTRREPVSWFTSGFARWWVDRLAPDPRLRVRAAAAGPVTVEGLRDWFTTRERLGPCLANAVEAGLVAVVAEQNPGAFQALATKVIGGERPGQDFRATLFRKGVDVDLDAVVAAFATRVEADRVTFADDLAKRRPLVAQSTLKAVGRGSGVEVHHSVQSDGGEPVDYTMRYATLRPWTGPDLTPLRFTTQGSGVLPQVFPRGTRLLTSFEVDEPALGCVIRLEAQRRELQ